MPHKHDAIGGFVLRDYQQAAVDHVCTWAETARVGDSMLIAAPTGVGKSIVELAIQARLDWPIITPRLEIARGFLQKQGQDPETLNELVEACSRLNIHTPIRLRNRLFRGEIPHIPGLIVDEGHHGTAASYRDDWVAAGMPPTVLLTATPYRGTSRSTKLFLEQWGEPTWMITLREAAERGDISIPTIEILPLVDDDIIQLNSTGEFDVESLESATVDRLADMARIAADRWYANGEWDRTTVFTLPTVALAQRMAAELENLGACSMAISAKTTNSERRFIFAALVLRKVAMCQVAVVGEGVDLPIRRLIDLAPVMSPVKFMQQLGRETRPVGPGEALPEYIGTNRNLLRHSYLLEGLVPAVKIAEAAEAFGGPGTRAGGRALGLEHLGRFKAVNVKLIDGNVAQLYMLVDSSNGRLVEYACVAHPLLADPIWAHRQHANVGTERQWAHWQPCAPPGELKGFVSQSPRPPSPKQEAWWVKSAKWHGLDPDVKLTRKNFSMLPLCKDLGLRLARKI